MAGGEDKKQEEARRERERIEGEKRRRQTVHDEGLKKPHSDEHGAFKTTDWDRPRPKSK